MILFILILLLAGVTIEEESIPEYFKFANLLLASDIYRELSRTEPGDFSFSPLAIQAVAYLALKGSRGRTSYELSALLHLYSYEKLTALIMHYIGENIKNDQDYKLVYHEKVFSNQVNIRPGYTNESRSFSTPKGTNMSIAAMSSEITDWIRNQSGIQFQEELTKIQVVIAQVAYFKAEWKHELLLAPIDEYLVQRSDAYKVMFLAEGEFGYYKDNILKCHYVELPFVGDKLSLVIVAPTIPKKIFTLENSISQVLDRKLDDKKDMKVYFPKNFFKITVIKLKSILQSLGVTTAFTNLADFYNMGDKNLHIAEIYHQTLIEVKTRAASFASGSANVIYRRVRSSTKPVLRIYHPFIFYIRHTTLGLMFVAKSSQPIGGS